MIGVIEVRRLTTGSIFKLVAVGLFSAWMPLLLLFGVAAMFGAGTVSWQGSEVDGVPALFAAVFIGALMAGMGTLLFGATLALGLWLYSLVRPMELVYRQDDAGERPG